MIRKFIKNWFNKTDDEYEVELPKNELAKFTLVINQINVGTLYCEGGEWYFKYTDNFKSHSHEYNLITGFPNVNETYKSETLWPFFKVRIPVLKQPGIKKILEEEQIDKENDVALLKRFGEKTIANPYKLLLL